MQLCCKNSKPNKPNFFMNSRSFSIDSLLKTNQIRPTRIRKQVLQLFFDVNYALSQADINDRLRGQFDRVTVYRTLETFEKHGLIHRVVDDSGVVKFASHGTGGCDLTFEHHRSDHLHFKCSSCNNIYCLCFIEVPEIECPAGFQLKTLHLIANGICDRCTIRNKKNNINSNKALHLWRVCGEKKCKAL
ncbi:MAG TPA: transcriptional repressor [bacterium]|nr:transcriptional repressor [bacterium]